jgi:thiol-disulfide isomerase/thioredoxin
LKTYVKRQLFFLTSFLQSRKLTLKKVFLCVVFLFSCLPIHCGPAPEKGKKESIPAPEFPKADWIGSEPLNLAKLKGKIVLLDFWTYCCINCIHTIPELQKLEEKWSEELVVIGVHSGKFPNEQGIEPVKAAVLKYNIQHPVINDPNYIVWSLYGIRAWPSFILIDPEGKIIARKSGEGVFDAFDPIVSKIVADFDLKGSLNRTPLPELKKVNPQKKEGFLYFPGAIASSPNGSELYISDSGRHRILIYNLDREEISAVIGGGVLGESGLKDGNYETARFQNPQGLKLQKDFLWVADTGNHIVRRIDLRTKNVTTPILQRSAEKNAPASDVPRSPWDLEFWDEEIWVAMAGNHQIWKIPVSRNKFLPSLGNGHEGLEDGEAKIAEFAQPSGLTKLGTEIYILDSETSALRSFSPKTREVKTLLGAGLFEFGDKDGNLKEARMQHPLGITSGGGKIFIADTYNHKIKFFSPEKGILTTLAGTGKPEWKDGKFKESSFWEPSGLVYREEMLYVADTNNHSIRKLDLKTGFTETLNLQWSTSLYKQNFSSLPSVFYQGTGQEISPESTSLRLNWKLPKGYIWKPKNRGLVQLDSSNSTVLTLKEDKQGIFRDFTEKLEFPISAQSGESTLTLKAVLEFCEEAKPKICMTRKIEIKTKYKVRYSGQRKPLIEFELPIQ